MSLTSHIFLSQFGSFFFSFHAHRHFLVVQAHAQNLDSFEHCFFFFFLKLLLSRQTFLITNNSMESPSKHLK